MDEEHKEKITPPDEQSPTEIPVQDNTIGEPEESKPETLPEPELAPAKNPDLVAQAEAEAPAAVSPAFPNDPPAKKSKAPLIAALASLLIVALGIGGYFVFLKPQAQPQAEPEIQHDIEPIVIEPEQPLEPIDISKLTLKNNDLSDFDLAFLRLENKQDNVVYSPLSIKYALAMLADGANGNSKEQITTLIGNYTPKAYLNSANRSLANAIFIKDTFKDNVLESYTQNLNSKYNASVILDPLTKAEPVNTWVSDKTLGIIDNLLQDSQLLNSRFVLVNALAIDMNWQNRIQCAYNNNDFPCIEYGVHYPNTNYSHSIGLYGASEHDFAHIGATSNHYDLITEQGGEANIRETVQQAYEEWLVEAETKGWDYDPTFDLNEYMDRLGNAGFGDHKFSTDFYFNDTDSEKIFAKDLKEYDGATLQYVGIMPKTDDLDAYLDKLTAEKTNSLISDLKDISDYNNFKDGVVTRVKGSLPLFKFSYSLELNDDLQRLGIVDLFDADTADLSNFVQQNEKTKGLCITDTVHKADIEFSNDGIRAAAATAITGGLGGVGPHKFSYIWELPVEEIDLTFDKPFLFLIRDKSTGEVWFTGTVYNPSSN